MLSPSPKLRRREVHEARRARSRVRPSAGMMMVTSRAMMDTTINNSTRVNPLVALRRNLMGNILSKDSRTTRTNLKKLLSYFILYEFGLCESSGPSGGQVLGQGDWRRRSGLRAAVACDDAGVVALAAPPLQPARHRRSGSLKRPSRAGTIPS